MTGCAGRYVKPIAPPEANVYCQQLAEPQDDSQNAHSAAFADAIEAYTDCAKRHKALVDWANGL